jgi:hypothetical protein
MEYRIVCRRCGFVKEPREVKPLRLPMCNGLLLVEHLHLTDHLIESAKARPRHQLTHFLGDEEKEIDDMLRLTCESFA